MPANDIHSALYGNGYATVTVREQTPVTLGARAKVWGAYKIAIESWGVLWCSGSIVALLTVGSR